MMRLLRAVGAAVLAVAVCVSGPADAATPRPVTPVRAAATGAPVVIDVFGDSISQDCEQSPPAGWCHEFTQLTTRAQVPVTIVSHAISGKGCSYWAPLAAGLIATDHPSLTMIYCGTNDGATTADERAVLKANWSTIVNAALAGGSAVAVSLIGYSNPEINDRAGRSWLVPNEVRVNALIRELIDGYPAGTFAGVADLRQMPGDWRNLADGTDGIHPNRTGQYVLGVLWYRAVRAGMGWPDVVAEPCEMFGHAPGEDPLAGWVLCPLPQPIYNPRAVVPSR